MYKPSFSSIFLSGMFKTAGFGCRHGLNLRLRAQHVFYYLHSICIDLTSYLPCPSLINSAQSRLQIILVYGKDSALWQFRLKLIIDRWDLPTYILVSNAVSVVCTRVYKIQFTAV